MSAALSVGFAGDAACDKTVRSNDGKRRIDVLFRKIGMEPAAATGIPGAIGDVLVCEIYTKRVAGEFDEAPKEAETERERPIRIWLARFDNTQIRYPGKLEAQTLFATIRGQVLSFRERPLTPAEARGHPALGRRHDPDSGSSSPRFAGLSSNLLLRHTQSAGAGDGCLSRRSRRARHSFLCFG